MTSQVGQALRRNWLTLLVGAALGLALGVAYVSLGSLTYVASATLAASAQGRVPTYVELAKTSSVTEPVSSETGLDQSEVRASVTVAQRLATSLVTVSARAEDPEAAVGLARAFSESLVDQVQELELGSTGSSGVTFLEIAQPASDASVTSDNADRLMTVAGFSVLGILLGALVIYVRTRKGLPLRDSSDVTRSIGLPVLSEVPRTGRARSRRISTNAAPTPSSQNDTSDSSAERLTSLLLDGATIVGVAHPTSGSESLLCATHLASALSTSQRVLLLDANVRPGGPNEKAHPVGLTEVLTGKSPVAEAIRAGATASFQVLPAGAPTVSASALLESAAFRNLIVQLGRDADLILVNLPAVARWHEFDHLPRMDGSVILALTRRATTDREAIGAVRQIRDHGQSLHVASIVG